MPSETALLFRAPIRAAPTAQDETLLVALLCICDYDTHVQAANPGAPRGRHRVRSSMVAPLGKRGGAWSNRSRVAGPLSRYAPFVTGSGSPERPPAVT